MRIYANSGVRNLKKHLFRLKQLLLQLLNFGDICYSIYDSGNARSLEQ